MDTSSVPQKYCKDCGQEFPATTEYFHAAKGGKYGVKPRCKPCMAAYCGHIYTIPRERLTGGEKLCKACDTVKPVSEFYQRKNGEPDWYCADCARTKAREKYVPSARVKKTSEALKERKRLGDKNYREANREKMTEKSREWVDKNRARVNQKNREWAKNHPEVIKARKARRRARERSAEGVCTPTDIKLQFDSQKGRCWHCGKKLRGNLWHADHLIPLARGGTNMPENIVISCPTCNLSRADKLTQEWNGKLF